MQPQNANSGVQLTFSSLADEKIKELQAIIDGITEPFYEWSGLQGFDQAEMLYQALRARKYLSLLSFSFP